MAKKTTKTTTQPNNSNPYASTNLAATPTTSTLPGLKVPTAATPTPSSGAGSPAPDQPTVHKDERGRNSGVTLPDGRTFLGLNPEDVNKVVSGYTAQTAIPEGAISQGQEAASNKREKQVAQALPQVGQVTAPTEGNFPLSQSIGGALPDIGLGGAKAGLTGAAGTAILGGGAAAAGAVAAGTVAAPVAAAALVGFALGGIGELKQEERANTGVAAQGYTSGISNIKSAIIYAKTPGSDPFLAVELYNKGVAQILQSEADLNQLAERDWLTKARKPLVKVQEFKNNKLRYDAAFAQALAGNQQASSFDLLLDDPEVAQ